MGVVISAEPVPSTLTVIVICVSFVTRCRVEILIGLNGDSVYAIVLKNMFVTLDTNIVYQAFRNPAGISGGILDQMRSETAMLALSNPVFAEYTDVLKRPDLLRSARRTMQDADRFLEFVAAIGEFFEIHYLFRPNLRDEADNMLIELALTSNSRFLVTRNIRDFTIGNQLHFPDLHIVSPVELLQQWR